MLVARIAGIVLAWIAFFTAGSVFLTNWYKSKTVTEDGWFQTRPYIDGVGSYAAAVYFVSAVAGVLLLGYLVYRRWLSPLWGAVVLVSALLATSLAEVLDGRLNWINERPTLMGELTWFSHEVLIFGSFAAWVWFLLWHATERRTKAQAAEAVSS